MCGCLAPYIIAFYRLGAEAKERIGAETKVSFFLPEVAMSPGCVIGVLRKHVRGKPRGGSLCCPFCSERVTYLTSCQAHPVSLTGVMSRTLSTCYLAPKLGFR